MAMVRGNDLAEACAGYIEAWVEDRPGIGSGRYVRETLEEAAVKDWSVMKTSTATNLSAVGLFF